MSYSGKKKQLGFDLSLSCETEMVTVPPKQRYKRSNVRKAQKHQLDSKRKEEMYIFRMLCEEGTYYHHQTP